MRRQRYMEGFGAVIAAQSQPRHRGADLHHGAEEASCAPRGGPFAGAGGPAHGAEHPSADPRAIVAADPCAAHDATAECGMANGSGREDALLRVLASSGC